MKFRIFKPNRGQNAPHWPTEMAQNQTKLGTIVLMKNLTSAYLANRLSEVWFDGKWVANTNLREQLLATSWQQATTKVGNLNTVAALAFHLNYYIKGVLDVFHGKDLIIQDRFSFDAPEIQNENDWNEQRDDLFRNASEFFDFVEKMNEEQVHSTFVREQYGSWLRNLDGMVEHNYYHLGQIVLLRKLIETSTILANS